MKSRKVWVIDIEAIKTARAINGTENEVNIPREATRMEATRFMWIPGERPVNVPAIIPAKSARTMIRTSIITILTSRGLNNFIRWRIYFFS